MYEKILSDKEIKNASHKKLRHALNDYSVSSFSKLELYIRIKKLRKDFKW